jgi:hypothetical protein
MNTCIRCLTGAVHPWHDDGTPHMPGLQPIIDGYTNFLLSAGDNDE